MADPFKSNGDGFAAVARGAVVGGTAWLWADDHAQGALDYLVVDEAGQMALACVLAAARAARNVVLLGDPQQLRQPHPPACRRTRASGCGATSSSPLIVRRSRRRWTRRRRRRSVATAALLTQLT